MDWKLNWKKLAKIINTTLISINGGVGKERPLTGLKWE